MYANATKIMLRANLNSVIKLKRDVPKVYDIVTFFSPCVLYLFGFFNPRNFSNDSSSRSAMFLSSGGAVQRAYGLIG